jgi:hypothetical protein
MSNVQHFLKVTDPSHFRIRLFRWFWIRIVEHVFELLKKVQYIFEKIPTK